jgi:hypothetical protein
LEEIKRAIKDYNLIIPNNVVVIFKKIEENERLKSDDRNVDVKDENNSSIYSFTTLPEGSTTTETETG